MATNDSQAKTKVSRAFPGPRGQSKSLEDNFDDFQALYPGCVITAELRNGQHFKCHEPVCHQTPWIRAASEFHRHMGSEYHKTVLDGRFEDALGPGLAANVAQISADFPLHQFTASYQTTFEKGIPMVTTQVFVCSDCLQTAHRAAFQGASNFIAHLNICQTKSKKTQQAAVADAQASLNRSISELRAQFPNSNFQGQLMPPANLYGPRGRISRRFTCLDCTNRHGNVSMLGANVFADHLRSPAHMQAIAQRSG